MYLTLFYQSKAPRVIWSQEHFSRLSAKILRIMKLIVLLMTMALMQGYATGYAQTVSISQRNVSLEKIFKEIRKQTGYAFLCTSEQMEQAHNVSMQVKNVSLKQPWTYVSKINPLPMLFLTKRLSLKERHSWSRYSGQLISS